MNRLFTIIPPHSPTPIPVLTVSGAAGAKANSLQLDIFPTLVDLLKIKPEHPRPLDGISLLPLLDGQMKSRPQPIGFWQFAGNQQNLTPNSGPSAWNDNQYKLVKPKPGVWELYDLVADRSEKTDLAATHPEVLNRMKAGMEQWHQSVIDSYNGKDYPENKVIQPPKPQPKTE